MTLAFEAMIYVTAIGPSEPQRVAPNPPAPGAGFIITSCKNCPNRPLLGTITGVVFGQQFDLYVAAFPNWRGTAKTDAETWLTANQAAFERMTVYVTDEGTPIARLVV